MKLLIKNMVCPRCIIVVKQLLAQHELKAKQVLLGEIELATTPHKVQLNAFVSSLQNVGFELLNNKARQDCEKIKSLIIKKTQEGNIERPFVLSHFLSMSLFKDYSLLTKVFTKYEGCTIEHFYILQKVEKAKEWLQYDQLAISDIAFQLGYSSSQHFSAQFKKITGLTPLRFKTVAASLRQSVDEIPVLKNYKPISKLEKAKYKGQTV